MKNFFIIILFAIPIFASEVATKDDIKLIVNLIKENNRQMDKRFETMQNSMDKRFETMQNSMDKRFEAMDKRFEDMNKRFELMQSSMDKRFEAMQNSMDKRFDDVNKRFDDVNKRFEDMNSKFNMIVTIMLAGFGLIMGYLIKERNSIKKDVKDEIDRELEIKLTQKADINLVERVVNVLEEFAKRNQDIANVLKKHNFIVK